MKLKKKQHKIFWYNSLGKGTWRIGAHFYRWSLTIFWTTEWSNHKEAIYTYKIKRISEVKNKRQTSIKKISETLLGTISAIQFIDMFPFRKSAYSSIYSLANFSKL